LLAANSTARAATWAGPTSAEAAIASPAATPSACNRPGRCAAMAEVTKEVAVPKTATSQNARRLSGAGSGKADAKAC
jgi:hypothetical protein